MASDDSLGMGTPIERRDVLHGLAAGIGAAPGGREYYPLTRLGMRDGPRTPGDAEDTGERHERIDAAPDQVHRAVHELPGAAEVRL